MPELAEKEKEIINFFLNKNILLTQSFFDDSNLGAYNAEAYLPLVEKSENLALLNELSSKFIEKNIEINWLDLDRSLFMHEKGNPCILNTFLTLLNQPAHENQNKEDNSCLVNVVNSYKELESKNDVQDFIDFFNSRYDFMRSILIQRRELKNLLSINKIKNKKEREEISIIAMVKSTQVTKNNNLIFSVEDQTGLINVLISKSKAELFSFAQDIQPDEVVAFSGTNGENIIFANNLFIPDVPFDKELKKSPDEVYALFLSDFHVGSKNFLQDKFEKFLKWINREIGSDEQKEIASKVKYLFIVGDLVDGIGVYPEQYSELSITDIHQQYEECAKLLSQIPQNIKVIMCPGNHDALRVAEPQPPFSSEAIEFFSKLKNVTLVSNPSVVNIHSSSAFPGFNIFLYHGYSFVYYSNFVNSIKAKGGIDRVDLVMKYLLQRRHLAPTHGSALYLPVKNDPLIISKIPDFFVTGHVHKASISNYRNITMVCGSCWQNKTSFEEKMGLHPEPGRIPIVNLHTREIKLMKF